MGSLEPVARHRRRVDQASARNIKKVGEERHSIGMIVAIKAPGHGEKSGICLYSIMKQKLLALHRWFGLTGGFFLLLIGLSGSLLVFRKSIDQYLNPSFYHLDSRGRRLSYDSLYSLVIRKYGFGYSSLSLDMPQSPGEFVGFTLSGPVRNAYSRPMYFVDFDPYSGEVLREGSFSDPSASFT